MRTKAWWAALAWLVLAMPAWADTLRVGGVERTYTVQAPATRPAPLVVVLHGNGQQGEDMRTRTAWPEVARREGFAVAFPDGLRRAWADLRGADERAGGGPPAGTDDIAFLSALVRHLVDTGVADPRRVYVTGVSNGGAMALSFACERADLVAGVGSVIMGMTRDMAAACHPARPVPVLFMNGTADPLVAFGGGRGSRRIAVSGLLSAQDGLRLWRRIDGCAAGDAREVRLPDRDATDGSRVVRVESRCPAGVDAVLYRVEGGGHRMPGLQGDVRMRRLVDHVLGPQNHDIDGAQVVWDFLRRFPR